MVTICHKGKPFSVTQNAVEAHLRHGDQVGPCPSNGNRALASVAERSTIPQTYELHNYPNPFIGTTRIRYSTPYNGTVTITVYDATGREVSTVLNRQQEAGYYMVDFDASKLGKGVYYYTLKARSSKGLFIQSKPMTVIR